MADRSEGTGGDGGLEAQRDSSALLPDFLSGLTGSSVGFDGSDGGTAGTLSPATTATFASVRGTHSGSLVVLSAAQQQSLQERRATSAGSMEEVPASVHRGAVPDLGVVLDHPVAGPLRLSSPFGWRVNPTGVGPAVQFHIGQDYPVACGTPVHAAADGTVRFAADRGTSGLRVDIDHSEGLASAYHHNSALLVSPGDRVTRGEVIALAGTTGNSTGCHVHFGITLDGESLDPSLVLPAVAGQPTALTADELQQLRQKARTTTGSLTSQRPDTPPARASAPRDTVRQPSDNTPPQATPPRPHASATAKPSTPSKPQQPSPTTRPTPSPRPTPPGQPTAKPTAKPTATARPTPPPTAAPSTPAPSTPAPTTPAPTEPPSTSTPKPTPTPEPTPPPEPTPDPEPTPTPSDPPLPGPEDPAPSPPPALTEEQAARWCVALDPEDLEGETIVITAETVLTEIIAVLNGSGEPELVDQELLTAVDPGTTWLESLPLCADEDFLAAAAADD